ncbi:iron-containing alcohol dehydrogenase [Pseudoalteromonas denitrificans]|uniref:NADP-dependent alcohol dehydrogenase n=1 Tax=Pseudoalteromonas denitrificans DSM 6059 TaxID=1123010 RepID=A0A1I1TNX9_9GAMM|nr:iron-containing alcohol dehydrogenase [Pseudoalteromonas denitrificans]SFD60194.1 NADP-dependent alcohol dehydrogenase [Pseudoalteromonas denitrificans DSM 6059]
MLNFTFSNKTRIHFGEQQISQVAKEIPLSAKVLITYGGGSIKKNGVYDQVIDALSEHKVFEFSGIEPNPSYEKSMEAIALVKQENIDFILAVGGGSVIDASKFIAAGALFNGEPWDILAKGATVEAAVALGAVLTLPATGSESNGGSVISKLSTKDKLPFMSDLVQPLFAVLDPNVMNTLPIRQLSNGVVDAYVHIMEQYLTYDVNGKIQDRFAEGLLLTLIEEGPKLFSNETTTNNNTANKYQVNANVMYSATLALNGLIGAGVPQDWATHMIGHEITAVYGLDHAQTLAIVLPRMMWEMRETKEAKLLQYADRIWNITQGDTQSRIKKAIEKTEAFFHSVQMKTRLSDYNLGEDVVDVIIEQLARHGMTQLGEKQLVTLEQSRNILLKSV